MKKSAFGFVAIFFVSFVFLSQPSIRASEIRTALVIGNGDYRNSPLRNPVNDAKAMADILADLGFYVIKGENLTQNRMKRQIDRFGKKIEQGGVGLFYYAGHGMQVKGYNYLIPVDENIQQEVDIEFEAVRVDRVLSKMDTAGNRLNIVILDACRNNPFARSFRSSSKGLAHMDAPSGTLIAYSTNPGSVAIDGEGKNGLYTEELLKHITTPGLRIEDVFKRVRTTVRVRSNNRQTPWEASSLEGDFYFLYSDNQNELNRLREEKKRVAEELKRQQKELARLSHQADNMKDKVSPTSSNISSTMGDKKRFYIDHVGQPDFVAHYFTEYLRNYRMEPAQIYDKKDAQMLYILISSELKTDLVYNKKQSKVKATVSVQNVRGNMVYSKTLQTSVKSSISFENAAKMASRVLAKKLTRDMVQELEIGNTGG
jgi:hypothetical protein